MQLIIDATGCVIPSLGNSSKQCDSTLKKHAKCSGKRVRPTKASTEHQIYKDAIQCTAMIIKEAALKYRLNVKDDLKEEVKDEKKCQDLQKVNLCCKLCNVIYSPKPIV